MRVRMLKLLQLKQPELEVTADSTVTRRTRRPWLLDAYDSTWN